MPFCPGTERWDRTPGEPEMPFWPRPRRFVPGQKGGTKRLGQKGLDRTSRYQNYHTAFLDLTMLVISCEAVQLVCDTFVRQLSWVRAAELWYFWSSRAHPYIRSLVHRKNCGWYSSKPIVNWRRKQKFVYTDHEWDAVRLIVEHENGADRNLLLLIPSSYLANQVLESELRLSLLKTFKELSLFNSFIIKYFNFIDS